MNVFFGMFSVRICIYLHNCELFAGWELCADVSSFMWFWFYLSWKIGKGGWVVVRNAFGMYGLVVLRSVFTITTENSIGNGVHQHHIHKHGVSVRWTIGAWIFWWNGWQIFHFVGWLIISRVEFKTVKQQICVYRYSAHWDWLQVALICIG